mmetsp:Transcript_93698/g.205085  ORF Transcript_93698/g.205085 Transcript_93698/m.205085 type:complete len:167 (+) Transcript_93698:73-573(+)
MLMLMLKLMLDRRQHASSIRTEQQGGTNKQAIRTSKHSSSKPSEKKTAQEKQHGRRRARSVRRNGNSPPNKQQKTALATAAAARRRTLTPDMCTQGGEEDEKDTGIQTKAGETDRQGDPLQMDGCLAGWRGRPDCLTENKKHKGPKMWGACRCRIVVSLFVQARRE